MNAMGKRAVVITGASTGIGRATALKLAANGFQVFPGVRKPEDAEALQRDAAGPLEPLILDITDAGQIEAAAERVAADVGDAGLAGLVNNAGMAVPSPLEVLPIDDLRRQLEVNLIGQVAVTQAFLPLLRKAKGRIVLVSSIGGRIALPFNGPYNMSKFGVEAMGDVLRRELRAFGIEVSLIEPGSVATPIWDKADSDADQLVEGMSEEAREVYGERIERFRPLVRETASRGVPPEQVAEAIDHALTAGRPKTRYVVGRDAKMRLRIARIVPDRVMDRLIARATGV